MSKDANEKGFVYNPESYLRTSVNVSVFAWLALLGLPVLMLFLIYSKVDDLSHQPAAMPQAIQLEQAQH